LANSIAPVPVAATVDGEVALTVPSTGGGTTGVGWLADAPLA
jgi:hypothetical protein